jgi:predicted HicB family RNase H-like nuclease
MSNTLRYKGYTGTVAFSEADQVFFGKVEGIDGLVNFEGSSVQELTTSFHEAVDDYLAYCEAEGIAPRKQYSGTLNIRIDPRIHSRIAELATEAGITINAFINRALQREVNCPLSVLQDGDNPYGTKKKI